MDSEKQEELAEINALIITENATNFLYGAARWAKFIAILGFVFVGIILLGGLVSGIIFSFMENEFSMFPFPPFLLSFIYLIMGVIYFFPIYYLFKFSTEAQKAIKSINPTNLELALRNIKSYFKFIGILLIIVLSIYALALISAIIFGIFFNSMF